MLLIPKKFLKNYRLFTSECNVYNAYWYGDFQKLMRFITYNYSENALRLDNFIRELIMLNQIFWEN